MEAWENGQKDSRKEFEEYLKEKDPEAFKHFHDNVLVNHQEYKS